MTEAQQPSNPNSGQPATPPPTPPVADVGKPVSLLETGEKPNATGETKPPSDKPPETPKPVVPDKYEFKDVDGNVVDSKAYADVARKLGLSQEAAQEAFAALAPSLQERTVAKIHEDHRAQAAVWAEAARKHPDFAGENFGPSMALVHKALEGHPAVLKFLTETGFGNKLETLQFLREVGLSRMPDTKVVTGSPEGGQNKPRDPQAMLAESYRN